MDRNRPGPSWEILSNVTKRGAGERRFTMILSLPKDIPAGLKARSHEAQGFSPAFRRNAPRPERSPANLHLGNMPQSLRCKYGHIVFSTKSRQPIITADLEPRLFLTNGMSGTEGGETARIAGGPSGRGLSSMPHRADARAEPLCFVRAAFQAGNSHLRNARRVPEDTPLPKEPSIRLVENMPHW